LPQDFYRLIIAKNDLTSLIKVLTAKNDIKSRGNSKYIVSIKQLI